MPFPSHHIEGTYCQHELSLLVVTLVTWLRCLGQVSLRHSVACSLSPYCTLREEGTMRSPHVSSGALCCPSSGQGIDLDFLLLSRGAFGAPHPRFPQEALVGPSRGCPLTGKAPLPSTHLPAGPLPAKVLALVSSRRSRSSPLSSQPR